MRTRRRESVVRRPVWAKAAVSWAVVVAGIAYLRRNWPERVLAASYARGGISDAEYRHRMAVLDGRS